MSVNHSADPIITKGWPGMRVALCFRFGNQLVLEPGIVKSVVVAQVGQYRLVLAENVAAQISDFLVDLLRRLSRGHPLQQ